MSYKKILIFCFVVAVALGIFQWFATEKKIEIRKAGFSLEKIQTLDSKVDNQFKLNVEASKLLSQPFFFYGKGRQFYVFISADGKFVIKFFQQQRFAVKDITSWPKLLCKKFKKDKALKKQKQKEELIASAKLSHDLLMDETAVLFVHLTRTVKKVPKIVLVDKRGNLLHVPLDDTQFVVQRRAEFLKPTIIRLMAANKEGVAKKRIQAIFDLLATCAKKGIQDGDGALIRNDNIGFLDDKAIYIDIGKLSKLPFQINEVRFNYDLRRLKPFSNWLEKNYPRLARYFNECKNRAEREFSADVGAH